MRFPKLHQLSIDIDDGLMDQPVMHFILQPLVVDEGTSRSLAMNVKDYIETHYSEKGLSLSQVASALFVNEGYLSRQLKQTYGRTFSEYLIEYRIQKAQELLRNLTLQYTVTAIANKVGYEDPHYFSRLFRKKTGFSPVQFREHAELLPNSNRE
ncbi:AraC family transcriptional regulator [Lactiplantibacillus plantarum]|uniref:helix-turn-helix transcriptional regulator n=1 Tax=Lactiplantibacillus plantarum TaxID=1590 RepID=UPI0039B77282